MMSTVETTDLLEYLRANGFADLLDQLADPRCYTRGTFSINAAAKKMNQRYQQVRQRLLWLRSAINIQKDASTPLRSHDCSSNPIATARRFG